MAKRKTRLVDVVAAGSLGGAARAANLTAKERQDAGREAVRARWDAYYAAHPEKLKAKEEKAARKGKVKRGRPPKKKGKPS